MTTPNRGQVGLKSSVLSPTSSKLTSQYIVLDHMKNHYTRIYNAKSAIDTSVPQSLLKSQKIRDRTQRRSATPQLSRPSSQLSKLSTHRSDEGYSDEEWGQPCNEEEDHVYNIMRNVLKPERRLHNQVTVDSASCKGYRTDMYYSRTGVNQRPSSARSTQSLGGLRVVKKRDPDVLNNRSHAFTRPQKPFTPRTLRTNRSSRLAEYKYYNSPPKTDKKNTSNHRRLTIDEKSKGDDSQSINNLTQVSLETHNVGGDASNMTITNMPRLEISIDQDNLNWLKEQATHAKTRTEKHHNLYSNSHSGNPAEVVHEVRTPANNTRSTMNRSRLRPADRQWIAGRLSAEEEELKYVEFVKEVTSDILARNIFTNRVLLQVFENHIQRRLHELDEKKMRSTLRSLRIQLGIPPEKSVTKSNNLIDDLYPNGLDDLASASEHRMKVYTNKSDTTLRELPEAETKAKPLEIAENYNNDTNKYETESFMTKSQERHGENASTMSIESIETNITNSVVSYQDRCPTHETQTHMAENSNNKVQEPVDVLKTYAENLDECGQTVLETGSSLKEKKPVRRRRFKKQQLLSTERIEDTLVDLTPDKLNDDGEVRASLGNTFDGEVTNFTVKDSIDLIKEKFETISTDTTPTLSDMRHEHSITNNEEAIPENDEYNDDFEVDIEEEFTNATNTLSDDDF